MKSQRLDKYLANLGYSSRRGVTEYLKQNQVSINGKPVSEPGTRFNPDKDQIKINQQPVEADEIVYYLVNKPVGYLTSLVDEAGHPSLLSLIEGLTQRVYPVGRLDVDSHGLILLTNDGELTYRLTHPKFNHPKKYLIQIDGYVKDKAIEQLQSGVQLKDGLTATAKVELVTRSNTSTKLYLTLREGKNRQIRRMCKALNLKLIDLQRVEIANLKLADLRPGQWRKLSKAEIDEIKSVC